MEFLDNFVPNWLFTIAEFLTIIFSLIGLALSFKLWMFFSGDKRLLSSRLKSEYFTDFLGFAILLFMGIGLYFNLTWLVRIDVVIRPLVVALNILAMWRLYTHYRKM